ncbi:MAG: hypothetical protein GKS00_25090 [Alphaproteobacteria bacterium]|nr:hypothetical protein [Alphaproteobacteria bacterium]
MPSLTEIEGIGPSLAAAFVKKRYLSIAKIAAAKPVELSAIPGISEKGATLIIASAKTLLANTPSQNKVRKRTKKYVAPLKVRENSRSKTNKDKGKKGKDSKVKDPKTSKDELSKKDKKTKQKIREMKKKIKKLKKEKKKIVAKDKKKAKKSRSKTSNKKK